MIWSKKLRRENLNKPDKNPTFACMRTWILILLVSAAGSGNSLLSAQEIRTNEKGEKIIVYPDGSWRYYDERSSDPFGKGNKETYGEFIPTDPEERKLYEDRKSQEQAIWVADRATNRAHQRQRQYRLAHQRRLALEQELENMKRLGKATDKKARQQTEKQLKSARKAEKTAYKDWQKALKFAQLAEQMIEASYKKRKKWLAKVDEEMNVAKEQVGQKFTQLDFGPAEEYATYDSSQDPMIHPPAYACHILRDEIDDFTGKRRRDMRNEELFSFTPAPLRPYLKGRTFIRCSAFISDVSGGLAYLTLTFHIASPNAHKSFGGIPRGNFILLQTLDGTQIRLRNTVTDPGIYRASDGSYTFRAQCTLSAGQQAILKKSEIDRMRVFWQAGYEDYEIFRVDFFKNQLNCLYP